MKKNLIFLLLIPLMFACSPQPKDGVLITGLIENYDSDVFQIGGPGGSRDSVMLDETGNFTYENLEITDAANYYIILGKDVAYIHLASGMEMDFYADMSNFKETMGFTGPGADINNYYSAKDPRAFDFQWFALPEDEFVFKADSLLAAQQGDLNAREKDDPEDPFWTQEEGEILYSWANNMNMYPDYHGYYAKVEDFEVSEGYYGFQEQLSLDKVEYLGARSYDSYISSTVRKKVGEKSSAILEKDSTAEIDRNLLSMEIGAGILSNPEIKSNYLTSTINDAMQWTDLNKLDAAIEVFKANVTDEEAIAKFEETYASWAKLAAGEPMFDFVGKDLEGNTVSSKDFRGKYLYVDVWATWCGPCIAEIPYLKQLEEDYHDRNVVFLSYSIDEDKDAWLKFVPEKELGGVQIIGEAAWESALCTNYKVRGVPTFMLFDTEGKIISVKMTRPSNQETRDTFDSYSDL